MALPPPARSALSSHTLPSPLASLFFGPRRGAVRHMEKRLVGKEGKVHFLRRGPRHAGNWGCACVGVHSSALW